MKMKQLFISLILLIITSCQNDDHSKIFNKYLEEINVDNFADRGIFIIIPENVCKSCFDETVNIIKNCTINKPEIIIILINQPTSEMVMLRERLIKNRIFLDKRGKINNLKYKLLEQDSRISLINMKEGEVKNIIKFDPASINSLEQTLIDINNDTL